jgi:NADH dehydrogenase
MKARRARRPDQDAPRVIVIGAGFGGLAAVRALSRTGARVTLIDKNVYSTFQPLLYQVATGGLNPGDVAYPVRPFTSKRGAKFRLGELAGIDAAARQITLTDGAVLGYDYLVLATGVSAAYFGVTGAAEHTLGLYTRRDAIALRDHIMARLERLDIAGPGQSVNVTVAGGGATGVELAGSLAELRDTALRAAFPEVSSADVHVRLIEMAPVLLAPFHSRQQDYAYRQLLHRGVDVKLSTKIREVTEDKVILDNGEELASDITVWAAGVAGPEAAAHWGLPQGRGGRITTGPDLRVTGQDRIFAIGDIALIDGQPLAQLAQPAIQEGRHSGKQIARAMAGLGGEEFHYKDKGTMATIGRRSAVVELAQGIRFRGTLAWLAWLALHLVTLLGGRNRLSALLNLSYRYITWGHGGGVIVGDDPPQTVAGGAPQQVPGAPAGPRQLSRPGAA